MSNGKAEKELSKTRSHVKEVIFRTFLEDDEIWGYFTDFCRAIDFEESEEAFFHVIPDNFKRKTIRKNEDGKYAGRNRS